MKPDLDAATEKVILLRREADRRTPSDSLLARIEDALSEGYAEALSADAWSSQIEKTLQNLIGDATAPDRSRLQALAREHVVCQRALVSFRGQLAGLRRDRDRMYLRASG